MSCCPSILAMSYLMQYWGWTISGACRELIASVMPLPVGSFVEVQNSSKLGNLFLPFSYFSSASSPNICANLSKEFCHFSLTTILEGDLLRLSQFKMGLKLKSVSTKAPPRWMIQGIKMFWTSLVECMRKAISLRKEGVCRLRNYGLGLIPL